MASSNNDSASGDGKESDRIKEALNTLRKKFCEDGTMDRLKDVFSQELRRNDSHKLNVERLQEIIGSSDQVSYEEAFKQLGGPAFRTRITDEDDLDGILRKLVKENNIALSEDEQKRLFEKWDKEWKRN